MKIKSKLILSFSILLSTCIILSSFNYYISNKSEESIKLINHYNNIINNSFLIQKNSIYFTALFSQLANPLNTKENRQNIYNTITIIRQEYIDALTHIQNNFDNNLVNNLNQKITAWRNFNIELTRLANRIDNEQNPDLIHEFNTNLNNNLHYQNETLKALDELIDHLSNLISTTTINTHNQLNYLKQISLILLLIILISGTIFIYLIIKSITTSLNTSIINLNDLSSDISNSSTQLSEASSILAESSSEQAASVEETSASLEEISSMVKQNSNNIHETNSLMNDAFNKLNVSNDSIKDLTNSIKTINTSSNEIFNIIKIIDEIAFQVNLLSLNASVEAARAGEHGNSFGVVAEEVRSLAIKAAKSSKDISYLIENIVKDIKSSDELIINVNNSFNDVFDNAKKVKELISEINEASKEQTIGLDQINLAISEIDKVTQHIASSSEETSASSVELQEKVDILKEVVKKLREI